MADDRRIPHVVIDAGGFIRNAPLKDIGVNLYTLLDVVHEIKDKATRQRLQVLPYELKFKDPSAESIKAVTDFTKKTGDYRSLSAIDIRVMALSYQLEKEHVGTDHIKTVPEKKVEWSSTTKHLEKPTEIAGFYLAKGTPAHSRTTSVSQDSAVDADDITARVGDVTLDNIREEAEEGKEEAAGDSESQSPKETITTEQQQVSDSDNLGTASHEDDKENGPRPMSEVYKVKDGDRVPTSILMEAGSDDSGAEDSEEESEEEDDDDEGWITPRNIRQVRQSMGAPDVEEEAKVTVGCLTTDFAMQNVLIQMGLNVVSVEGMLIRRVKSYVLRCFACMKVTTKMDLQFCPHCGNKTLQKLSMSVNEDGSIRYYLSRRRPVSVRGLRYSLPKPQGGKHAVNPVLCADQPGAQQRTSKASRVKYNAFDPDYLAHTSPFAPIDTTSRAAQLGIRANGHNFKKRRNPNENKKVYGRRK